VTVTWGYKNVQKLRQIKLRLRDRSLSTNDRLRPLETMRQVSRPHSLMLEPELSESEMNAMSKGLRHFQAEITNTMRSAHG
jgi:hypothetical protein